MEKNVCKVLSSLCVCVHLYFQNNMRSELSILKVRKKSTSANRVGRLMWVKFLVFELKVNWNKLQHKLNEPAMFNQKRQILRRSRTEQRIGVLHFRTV